jgi:cyclophilin family peptidyl-prolyl cis-trans isomerase
MPITSGNFIDLANGGFYDNIHFHRVIPNFMNQFGCPHARDPGSPEAGTGGPPGGSTFASCDGKMYTRNQDGGIPDEVGQPDMAITNAAGTLSMANTGTPESGGSQFFINVKGKKERNDLNWFELLQHYGWNERLIFSTLFPWFA